MNSPVRPKSNLINGAHYCEKYILRKPVLTRTPAGKPLNPNRPNNSTGQNIVKIGERFSDPPEADSIFDIQMPNLAFTSVK